MTSGINFRLTVRQFACCLQCSEEVARRHLRANKHGVVTKRLAMDTPWKISPAALELFGVDQTLARELLTAANLLPATHQSKAAPSPQPSPV